MRAMLLADGAVADCTAIVLEILDLLLRTNRHAEIRPLVEHMLDAYCDESLPIVRVIRALAHGNFPRCGSTTLSTTRRSACCASRSTTRWRRRRRRDRWALVDGEYTPPNVLVAPAVI